MADPSFVPMVLCIVHRAAKQTVNGNTHFIKTVKTLDWGAAASAPLCHHCAIHNKLLCSRHGESSPFCTVST